MTKIAASCIGRESIPTRRFWREGRPFGAGARRDGARPTFPVVNNGGIHRFPAVVLASVLGYRSGTCTLAISAADLRQACELLAPVEACTEYTHPNLWAWRDLLRATPNGPFFAVFIAGPDASPVDDLQASFLGLADNTE